MSCVQMQEISTEFLRINQKFAFMNTHKDRPLMTSDVFWPSLTYLSTYLPTYIPTYLLDVLWCQPIKLIQVVSTSEFHEY